MTSDPRFDHCPEQPYIAIPIQVTLTEWGQANELLGEVLDWMHARDIRISGPPMYRYRIIGDVEKKFDLEVGWLVSSAVEGDGRVLAGTIPAGRYLRMTHTGHPDRLEESFERMMNFAREQGIEWQNHHDGNDEIWGGRFELYMTDPAVEPDLENWKIELMCLTRKT